MDTALANEVTVYELTEGEARDVFDARCREELGVSGDIFMSTYRAGRLPEDWSPEAVSRVEMLLPLVQ